MFCSYFEIVEPNKKVLEIKDKLLQGEPIEGIANMFEDECICDNLGLMFECKSDDPDCWECACDIAKKIKIGEIE